MSTATLLLRHRPMLTLKSYGSKVNNCSCDRFTPFGDDEQSWKQWAQHVEEEIRKHELRQCVGG